MNKKALYNKIMEDVAVIVKKHLNETKRYPGGVMDREETIEYNGDEYRLCIIWNEDYLKRSAFAMTPDYAFIRKNGENFAMIDVDNGNPNIFFVKQFTKRLFDKPEWMVKIKKHINDISFEEILSQLPLQINESYTWNVKFKEVGRRESETSHTGNLKSKKEVADFFGLYEPDIEWFKIELVGDDMSESEDFMLESDDQMFSWVVKFKEAGKRPSETRHHGRLKSKKEVIEFFGLDDPEIEWFEIEQD